MLIMKRFRWSMIFEISMHTLVRILMISFLNLYLMNWTSMCLLMTNMGLTRSLVDLLPVFFQWYDQLPQHGHQNSRPRCKPQHLEPSSQLRIMLLRGLLCYGNTLNKWGPRYPNPHLYLWTTWVWYWTRRILVAPWTRKTWRLATILLGIMFLTMLWRWGRYTIAIFFQTYSSNPLQAMISMGFNMSA